MPVGLFPLGMGGDRGMILQRGMKVPVWGWGNPGDKVEVSFAGQAKEMSAQAAKRPETKCREFKASLLNGILVRLRDTLEMDMEVSLPLVSEQEEHSYSDVSLLLRSYMDLCAGYAEKHYNLRFDFQGRQLPPGRFGYGHRF